MERFIVLAAVKGVLLKHDVIRESVTLGDVSVHSRPAILQTLLGSCVSACLFDPVARIGGINHFLLPDGSSGGSAGKSARFGIHAMEILIYRMLESGADKRRLVAKAFGGANVLPGISSPTAGEQNVAFLKSFLAKEKVHMVSHRFGGVCALQLHFHTCSGRAFIRPLCKEKQQQVVQVEKLAFLDLHMGELTPY